MAWRKIVTTLVFEPLTCSCTLQSSISQTAELHTPPAYLMNYTYLLILFTFNKNNPLKQKVKLSLCLIKHHAINTYMGVEVQ
jgi:hypothetical protein